MDRNEAIDILRVIAPPRTNKKAFYDFMEARDMAIAALEKAPTALDHIHNVVAEREYQRGYEQAKEKYDHKLTVIKGRIKDHYYNKGYEQGKAETNLPEIPDSWVDAITVPWIEAEIKKLRDMDNGFASLSAGQIEAMLKKWKEEQNNGQK